MAKIISNIWISRQNMESQRLLGNRELTRHETLRNGVVKESLSLPIPYINTWLFRLYLVPRDLVVSKLLNSETSIAYFSSLFCLEPIISAIVERNYAIVRFVRISNKLSENAQLNICVILDRSIPDFLSSISVLLSFLTFCCLNRHLTTVQSHK